MIGQPCGGRGLISFESMPDHLLDCGPHFARAFALIC
jgi:hypothetical protein